MQEVFLYKYPQPAVSAAGEARATALLRTARDAELQGLAAIERIVNGLKAGSPTTTPGDGTMIRIETKRLVLRPFTAADWRDFQELSVDWAAAPGPAFDKWPTTEEACKDSVQHMATRDKYLALCLRESGKVVGLLALNGFEKEGCMDLGHVILSQA